MMQTYQPGETLLLKFPFSNVEEAKHRPALVVLDVGDNDIVVARITTHISRSSFDVEIKNWREAGLKARSFVRLHKLATLEKNLVDRKLGKLTPSAWDSVQVKWKELWDSVSREEAE
jgi:mRNA interferase MazF